MSLEKRRSWSDYYKEAKDAPPRKYIVAALEHVSNFDAALDLGAGTLRDTKLLLEHFRNVTAIDSEPAILGFAEEINNPKLKAFISSFEHFDFEPHSYDLVNAQYSLPFADPESFKDLFDNIVRSIRPRGIFVGTFFGPHDSWSKSGGKARVFNTKEELQMMFKDFEILEFLEIEEDGTAGPQTKHWHRFHITARKL